MDIIGPHHIALITSNFDRLHAFYVEVLGFPVVGEYPGRRILFMELGSIAIELIERQPLSTGNTGGWGHLALQVVDVDAAHAELARQGVPFHIVPTNFPDDAPQSRIAFFRDPDGNELQLVQPLGKGRFPGTT